MVKLVIFEIIYHSGWAESGLNDKLINEPVEELIIEPDVENLTYFESASDEKRRIVRRAVWSNYAHMTLRRISNEREKARKASPRSC